MPLLRYFYSELANTNRNSTASPCPTTRHQWISRSVLRLGKPTQDLGNEGAKVTAVRLGGVMLIPSYFCCWFASQDILLLSSCGVMVRRWLHICIMQASDGPLLSAHLSSHDGRSRKGTTFASRFRRSRF